VCNKIQPNGFITATTLLKRIQNVKQVIFKQLFSNIVLFTENHIVELYSATWEKMWFGFCLKNVILLWS